MTSVQSEHDTIATHAADSLGADLRRRVRGVVLADGDALSACSVDYGGMRKASPAAVVRPECTGDVVAVLQYATRRSVRVVARGAGHSQGGQPLCESGIVVDMSAMRGMERISPDGAWAQAWAGTSWADFTAATNRHGLRPPVLTDNLATTLGGTHAAGGFGVASLRHGAQVGHCVGVELVTGAGEVRWCTEDENAGELACALGGLGQLGIITRVRHRLRRCLAFERTHVLKYLDIPVMLDDLHRLRAAGGVTAAGIGAEFWRGRWVGTLFVMEETDRPATDGLVDATADLRPARRIIGRARSTTALMPATTMKRDHRHHAPNTVRPCLDVLLPAPVAAQYCDVMLEVVRGAMRDRARVAILPVSRVPGTPSLLVLPHADDVVLVGVYTEVPYAQADGALHTLRELRALALQLGGTLYPIGSIPLDGEAWRSHLGDAWPGWAALKRRHDPACVLASGIGADRTRASAGPTPTASSHGPRAAHERA